MNILTISLANLRFRALGSFFNVLVLALGISLIITLLHISQQIEQRFTKDLAGIDLVVGAKGSPIQLFYPAYSTWIYQTAISLLRKLKSWRKIPW
jgi:putative ABC transport system permease protein